MASSTANLSPEDLAYYAQQQAAVKNTNYFAQQENENAKAGADLTYAQKLQALGEKLGQEQAALPDKFAARGIQNSGIYNYGGTERQYTGAAGPNAWQAYTGLRGGQMGALQQFGADSATALGDLRNQQENVDQGYGIKGQDLNNTANNQLQGISATEAAQNASQAASDAIGGA